jgi:hypothetical protein
MHRLGPERWPENPAKEFHGQHVAKRKAGFESIEWQQTKVRDVEVRVLSHTCECLVIQYELCGQGGVYFIRRTTRGGAGDSASRLDVVHESPRGIAARTGGLWFRLLSGLAR